MAGAGSQDRRALASHRGPHHPTRHERAGRRAVAIRAVAQADRRMNSDWLKQLAPEHAPSPPWWWPPAPGWWGVALLSILVAAGIAWWMRDPRRGLGGTGARQFGVIGESDA